MADPVLNLGLGVDDKQLIEGLRRAGFELVKFEKGVKQSAAGASIALTNLARVAQDAPFGFIAIANNLDPLVQSLGSLSKSSGGALGALKALGGALIGPAGIALAFSAVTSGITFAIQKYGSLGAAIDAVFGRTNSLSGIVRDAAKSYEEFNKNARTAADIAREEAAGLQGQIVRVQQLAVIIGDQTKSYNERNTALKDLKSINKDYFGDLKIEQGLVAGLTSAVAAYVEAQVLSAKAKGFEKALGETTVQISDQETKLRQLGEARDAAIRAPQRFIGRADIVDTRAIQEATDAYKEQEGIVKTLRSRSGELEGNLRTLTTQLNALKAQYTGNNEEQNKVADAINRSSKSVRDNTSDIERNRAALERQRKELELLQKNFEDLARATETDIDINRQFQQENPPEPPPQQFPFDPIALITAQINAENAKKKQDEYNESIKSLVSTFNDLLSPAINTIFGALENGQNVFKALGQSLKALIVQLVATVAKAAILAVILSAISGGGFALGAVGSVAGGTGNFGGIFKNLLGTSFGIPKKTAAPTFSGAAGINAGGIQLAGQVVFVQRGTDLVGVLNQGNARIGRVG